MKTTYAIIKGFELMRMLKKENLSFGNMNKMHKVFLGKLD